VKHASQLKEFISIDDYNTQLQACTTIQEKQTLNDSVFETIKCGILNNAKKASNNYENNIPDKELDENGIVELTHFGKKWVLHPKNGTKWVKQVCGVYTVRSKQEDDLLKAFLEQISKRKEKIKRQREEQERLERELREEKEREERRQRERKERKEREAKEARETWERKREEERQRDQKRKREKDYDLFNKSVYIRFRESCRYFNIDKTCSYSQVKSIYRKLSMETHPDKGGDADEFKCVSNAYENITSYKKIIEPQWDKC
tara:strand:+ start:340 stop:1122 length:783 start_codon:yes stop_codon:yes gene_type:complete